MSDARMRSGLKYICLFYVCKMILHFKSFNFASQPSIVLVYVNAATINATFRPGWFTLSNFTRCDHIKNFALVISKF